MISFPFRIFVAVFVLAVLFFASRYALDPQESRNQEIDSQLLDEAGSLVSGISEAIQEDKNFLWDGQSLAWTKADSLDTHKLVSEGFLKQEAKFAQSIFVGKGDGKDDKIWACFAPVSKHERVDTIKLRSVAAGEELPKDGIPKYCEEKPDWQNSFCFTCISQ